MSNGAEEEIKLFLPIQGLFFGWQRKVMKHDDVARFEFTQDLCSEVVNIAITAVESLTGIIHCKKFFFS